MPAYKVKQALIQAGLAYYEKETSRRSKKQPEPKPKPKLTYSEKKEVRRKQARLATKAITFSSTATAAEVHDTIVRHFSHIFSSGDDPRSFTSTSRVPLFVFLKRDRTTTRHGLEIANHGRLMSAPEIAEIAFSGLNPTWRRWTLDIGK